MKSVLAFLVALLMLGCAPQSSDLKTPKPVECKPANVQSCPAQKECPLCETTVIEKECPKVHPCAPCPECKQKPCKPITIYKEYNKRIFGSLEKVYLPIPKLLLEARIDTGAQTSSIHAENIMAFERDGKDWVRFEMRNAQDEVIKLKRPLVKTIKVKRHEQEAQNRYVIHMRINIADVSNYIEVSLTDRGQYSYPVLIGRNYLQGNAVVDVSLKHTKEPTRKSK